MAKRITNDKIFDFNELSMRELQTFLIILQYEGEPLAFIKDRIDKQFNHQSRTKGYDYINTLCAKGLIYKRKLNIKDTMRKLNIKDTMRVFIYQDIRKRYEKLIIPTLNYTKEAIKNYLDEYFEEVEDVEKIREKFSNYTEELKNSIIIMLKNSSIKEKEIKQLKKKILEVFENRLKVELVKYQLFSE